MASGEFVSLKYLKVVNPSSTHCATSPGSQKINASLSPSCSVTHVLKCKNRDEERYSGWQYKGDDTIAYVNAKVRHGCKVVPAFTADNTPPQFEIMGVEMGNRESLATIDA